MKELCKINGFIRRPIPLVSGMRGRIYAPNGPAADTATAMGKTNMIGSEIRIDLLDSETGEDNGHVVGELERPKNEQFGVVLQLFAENGPDADRMIGLGLTAFQDKEFTFRISVIKSPEGMPQEPEIKGDNGMCAQTLQKSGFLFKRAVLESLGSDAQYIDWCRGRPSAISGEFNEYLQSTGEGRCVYAHYRRINRGAGIGLKPPFSGLPMRQDEHLAEQDIMAQRGHDWFEQQVDRHLRMWAWERLKFKLKVSSMTQATPDMIIQFCDKSGITELLPDAFWVYVKG